MNVQTITQYLSEKISSHLPVDKTLDASVRLAERDEKKADKGHLIG